MAFSGVLVRSLNELQSFIVGSNVETLFTFSAARALMSGPCVVSGSEP